MNRPGTHAILQGKAAVTVLNLNNLNREKPGVKVNIPKLRRANVRI